MKLLQTFSTIFVFAILVTRHAAAQPVSAGLKVGAPLTDVFHNSTLPTFAPLRAGSNDYTIGPFVELRLPARFAIEADALYRGVNYVNATGSTSKSQWEFPIVAKYKLLGGPVKPYIEGGLAFSHLSDVKTIATANHNTNFGVVIGGGIEIHALVLRISPEIRYTGYALKDFDSLISTNRNQVAFLVGIGF